ncbi:MAG: YbaB/EbfC family nucleoid-associated protein [Lactobacillales bacterium]|nr:YbaB/EbfC family nucleoid-associated protein [Lactobacillales bacterium]
MNIQAMMKQAQKLQKDMMEEKNKIDSEIFEGKSSIVTVKVKGTKEVLEINIDSESIEADEMEMVQDMIIVAINDAMKQIDKETDKRMGKYTQGMPGLF